MATPRFPVSIEDLGHKWGWFLVLGILLILLGITSLVYTPRSNACQCFNTRMAHVF